jgi:hypothetical protein
MGVVWATAAAVNAGAVVAKINKKQSTPGEECNGVDFVLNPRPHRQPPLYTKSISMLPLLVVFQVFAMERFHLRRRGG